MSNSKLKLFGSLVSHGKNTYCPIDNSSPQDVISVFVENNIATVKQLNKENTLFTFDLSTKREYKAWVTRTREVWLELELQINDEDTHHHLYLVYDDALESIMSELSGIELDIKSKTSNTNIKLIFNIKAFYFLILLFALPPILRFLIDNQYIPFNFRYGIIYVFITAILVIHRYQNTIAESIELNMTKLIGQELIIKGDYKIEIEANALENTSRFLISKLWDFTLILILISMMVAGLIMMIINQFSILLLILPISHNLILYHKIRNSPRNY